jgi:small subunit ribosomal protein S7
MAEQSEQNFKIFDIYDVAGVQIKDIALKPYINFAPKILLKSHGRQKEKQYSSKVNIIERLANRLAVPGHVGKKHKVITSWSSGKYNRNMKTILRILEKIQKKTQKNPVQVIIDAIENGSPRDEITVIESGGARYPQAVDCSPTRRVNLAIRWMVQGAYGKAFGKKKLIADTLADEIMNAAAGSMDSYAVNKKTEAEKQADSAR